MTDPLLPRFWQAPFAHRALHGDGRPENSLSAVRAAVAGGYGIEIDVQPAADGTAMVFHDPTLERLTPERGDIAERDVAALRAIPLTGGDGEGIPTLADVLAEVDGRSALLIEIKDRDDTLGPPLGALEASVAAALESYDGPAAIMSFNPHVVAEMALLAPRVPRGLTTCDFASADWPMVPPPRLAAHRGIAMFDQVGASFISHQASDLASASVARLKARGVPVFCWTIRSPEEEAEARRYADQVTFEGYLP